MEIKLEDIKIIMADLIRAPRIADEKYKSAYVDGVLDFFNRAEKILAKPAEVVSEG